MQQVNRKAGTCQGAALSNDLDFLIQSKNKASAQFFSPLIPFAFNAILCVLCA